MRAAWLPGVAVAAWLLATAAGAQVPLPGEAPGSPPANASMPAEPAIPSRPPSPEADALFTLVLLVPGIAMIAAIILFVVGRGGAWGEDARKAAERRLRAARRRVAAWRALSRRRRGAGGQAGPGGA